MRITIFYLLAISIISSYVVYTNRHDNVSTVYNSHSILEKYEKIKKIIDNEISGKEDLEKGYSVFKSLYQESEDKKVFHNIGHWLGGKIYEIGGISRGDLCDDTAGYGCFHGFIEKAYNENGDLTKNIKDSCAQPKPRGSKEIECIHGIGHGLLTLRGYNISSLEYSLSRCNDEFTGLNREVCVSGAFMEYNIQTMINMDDKGFDIRKSDDLYSPCESMHEIYKIDCYRELPYWWFSMPSTNPKDVIERCESIKEKEAQHSCFSGVGRFVPWAVNYDIKKIESICGSIKDNYKTLLCIENAAFRMLYSEPLKAYALCSSINKEYQSLCTKNINVFKCEHIEKCL